MGEDDYNYDDDDDGYPILADPENYGGKKEQGFSHQKDVARAIARVLETGSVEMKPGYTDFKKDKNSGELLMSKYHPDTREMFIESVNNYYDICIAEIDDCKNEEVTNRIKAVLKKKKDCYEGWAVKEHKFWESLNFKARREFFHIKGSISKDSPFYAHFMTEMVSISRELVRELNLLLKEGLYWERVVYTN